VFKVQFCSRFPVAAFTNRRQASRNLAAQQLLTSKSRRQGIMSLVRLLGYTTLACGCVVGRYREVASSRELAYVEEKGNSCAAHGHRRNHTVSADRVLVPQPALAMSRTA